jgi:hypothetical protein
VVAGEACSLVGYQSGERPASASPTEISVGLVVADIMEISDLGQTISLDGVLHLRWRDPRLIGVQGCRFPMETLWHPEVQLLNAGELARRGALELQIGDDGQVVGRFRVSGSIVHPLHMPDFPFDSHELTLQIMSLVYDVEDVVLTVDEQRTFRRPELTIPDWRVGQVSAISAQADVPFSNRTVSMYQFRIPVERLSSYYVYKIVIPLIMIVLMSCGVFWVDPKSLSPQMALAGTSMLTLITFQFTMNDLLPRISYLTQLDKFILSSSVLVFFALVEAVVTGYLASHDKPDFAKRVDSWSRIGFPTIFALVVVFTLVV